MKHTKELLETLDHIEGLPGVNFNLREWLVDDPNCGSVGCVCGYHVLLHSTTEGFDVETLTTTDKKQWESGVTQKTLVSAGKEYFGITEMDFEFLFRPFMYGDEKEGPTQINVLRRVRAYVAQHAPRAYKKWEKSKTPQVVTKKHAKTTTKKEAPVIIELPKKKYAYA